MNFVEPYVHTWESFVDRMVTWFENDQNNTADRIIFYGTIGFGIFFVGQIVLMVKLQIDSEQEAAKQTQDVTTANDNVSEDKNPELDYDQQNAIDDCGKQHKDEEAPAIDIKDVEKGNDAVTCLDKNESDNEFFPTTSEKELPRINPDLEEFVPKDESRKRRLSSLFWMN